MNGWDGYAVPASPAAVASADPWAGSAVRADGNQASTLGYIGSRLLGGFLEGGKQMGTAAAIEMGQPQQQRDMESLPPGQQTANQFAYGQSDVSAPNAPARYLGNIATSVGANPVMAAIAPGYTAMAALGSEGGSDINKMVGAPLPDWGARLVGGIIPGLASGFMMPRGDAADFIAAGGRPTPGQVVGAPNLESTLGKIPGFTGAINNARDEALESFNRSTINQVLAPIGETLEKNTPGGNAALAEAAEKFSSAYKNAAGKGPIAINPETDFAAARAMVPANQEAQFSKILESEIENKLENGALSGADWQTARQNLGKLAYRYSNSADADHQALGDALTEAQNGLHNALAASNPEAAQQIANANAGWRLFKVAQKAAGSAAAGGRNEGIFTPNQLLQASRTIGGESAFARGVAPLQPWGQTAYRVIGANAPVNTSMLGTAEALAGAYGAYTHPAVAGAAAVPLSVLRMIYSAPGRAAMNFTYGKAYQPGMLGLTQGAMAPGLLAASPPR